jgi:phosphohistidine phosphatase
MKPAGKKERKRKKLIFIRHGKAEELVPEISDFDRSLTTKGKHNTRLMARILKSNEKDPGLIISSPAFRAYETAMIFCREYEINPDSIKICSDLYFDLQPEDFVTFIQSQSDEHDTISLFGHNPLITAMAAFFAADEPDELPKTGIFCISFEAGSWKEIGPDSGTTEYFLKPKSLK